MPANLDQLEFARTIFSKYLQSKGMLEMSDEQLAGIEAVISSGSLPPRDLFGPALETALSTLQVRRYVPHRESHAARGRAGVHAGERTAVMARRGGEGPRHDFVSMTTPRKDPER